MQIVQIISLVDLVIQSLNYAGRCQIATELFNFE